MRKCCIVHVGSRVTPLQIHSLPFPFHTSSRLPFYFLSFFPSSFLQAQSSFLVVRQPLCQVTTSAPCQVSDPLFFPFCHNLRKGWTGLPKLPPKGLPQLVLHVVPQHALNSRGKMNLDPRRSFLSGSVEKERIQERSRKNSGH